MSHVDFKEWPCRRVELRCQWPSTGLAWILVHRAARVGCTLVYVGGGILDKVGVLGVMRKSRAAQKQEQLA